MTFDTENARLREAYRSGQLTADTPEIAAIFEQIKGLREADRSLRSLRRTMELDNVPSLDALPEDDEPLPTPPATDLTKLLDSFLALRDEKDALETRLDDALSTLTHLQEAVAKQAKVIETLQNG
jgi:hypothetical protein